MIIRARPTAAFDAADGKSLPKLSEVRRMYEIVTSVVYDALPRGFHCESQAANANPEAASPTAVGADRDDSPARGRDSRGRPEDCDDDAWKANVHPTRLYVPPRWTAINPPPQVYGPPITTTSCIPNRKDGGRRTDPASHDPDAVRCGFGFAPSSGANLTDEVQRMVDHLWPEDADITQWPEDADLTE